MGQEIERKFLVNSQVFIPSESPIVIKQGYLSVDPERTIRVRIADENAILTIKGKVEKLVRPEFEYEIPLDDGEALLKLTDYQIVKKRYLIQYERKLWEVDEFLGDNRGLWIAEIELEHQADTFCKPDWIGKEVSDDYRFFNSYLSKHPYKGW